jgi:pyrrolidone-carboxylate peptidase
VSASPLLVASTDAGGFYCEHAHFAHVDAAHRRGLPVDRVGFLHVPDDEPSWGRPGPRPFESTLAMVDRMVKLLLPHGGRLLLTGFAPWGLVVDNPSGAFVASPRALAALAESDAPIPQGGALVAKGRRIEIVSAVLPVTDDALDPGSGAAIPSLHDAFRPDAVLALGVVANGDTSERIYRVELCATNRNLQIRDGRWLHAADAPATIIRPTRALRAAISFDGTPMTTR